MHVLQREADAVCVRCSDGFTEWQFSISSLEVPSGIPLTTTQRQQNRTKLRSIPDRKEFPRELRNFIYESSLDGTDSNLLVLFHGLGDSPEPFASLGRRFALPQTAVLALQAPFPLPLDLGYCWFNFFGPDGIPIKPAKSNPCRVKSMSECLVLLNSMLSCLNTSWKSREIFLFGFSQGGCVALEWALSRFPYEPFGGVVSVAGCVLEEHQWPDLWPVNGRCVNSVNSSAHSPHNSKRSFNGLIIAGNSDLVSKPSWVHKSLKIIADKTSSQEAAIAKFFDKGHTMMCSAHESRAFMEFIAPLLSFSSAWEWDPDVHEISLGDVDGSCN
jgi:predicted esterase